MSYLSPVSLARLAIEEGPKWPVVRAVAVMLAESDGNTNAHNTRGGNDARGLMQINVAPQANPQYASRNLYDARTNVRTGYELWQQHGWRPWDASRARQVLMTPVATAAYTAAIATNPRTAATAIAQQEGIPSPTSGPTSWGDAITGAYRFFSSGQNWGRIGKIALGGVLLVVALNVLAKPVAAPIGKGMLKP